MTVFSVPEELRLNADDCCVLMATYSGETAQNLEACFDGIAAQTEAASKIVLIVDGPIDREQENVIERYFPRLPMNVVRLPVGRGLAIALNAGLPFCDREFIMRVDSDDVSRPDRFAIQLRYMRAHPEIQFLSAWVREVFDDGAPPQIKVSPTEHDDIVQALRWRNVVAHPAALMQADAVRAIGGYRPEFGMLEDYDLFVRLAQSGARFHIIPKILVDCGASAKQKERRGGLSYFLPRNEFSPRSSRYALCHLQAVRRDWTSIRCVSPYFGTASPPSLQFSARLKDNRNSKQNGA